MTLSEIKAQIKALGFFQMKFFSPDNTTNKYRLRISDGHCFPLWFPADTALEAAEAALDYLERGE